MKVAILIATWELWTVSSCVISRCRTRNIIVTTAACPVCSPGTLLRFRPRPVFSPPRDRIGKFAPPLETDQRLKVGIVWSGRRHLQAQPGNSQIAAALFPRSCLARGPTLQSAERPARTRILSQSPNDRFWRKADVHRKADVRKTPTRDIARLPRGRAPRKRRAREPTHMR